MSGDGVQVHDEAAARAAVVAEARNWRGCPYHHAAMIKGVGVDCACLLVAVFRDVGLIEPFDPRPYTKDWMLHRSEEKFLGLLLARAHEVAAPGIGDVALMRVGRCFAHGAIVTETGPLTILHAYAPARRVIEEAVERTPAIAQAFATARFASFWGSPS